MRRNSYNQALLRVAADLPPAGAVVTLFEAQKEIPVFDEDLEDQVPPAVVSLWKAVTAADAVLFATPEYNQSIPGSTKNLLDWLSRSEILSGKPVAVIGASPGPWGTRIAQAQLRQMLLAVQAAVLPAPHLYVNHVDRRIDDTGAIRDPETIGRVANVVGALAAWTRLTKPSSRAAGEPVPLLHVSAI